MAVAWPHVKAWLVSTIPTLSGLSDVVVYAGPPATEDDPARYVTVGFVTDDSGGAYQQTEAYDGLVWQEIGEVRSQFVAQLGDEDPSLAEANCFAMADALDAKIRNDRTLGGTLSPEGTTETSVEVHTISNPNGTATALVHVLRYTTTA